MDLAKRAAASVRRHPMAADVTLALAFAAAALISVKTILDEISSVDPSFPQPATAAVVVSMLGITLPLAWRRRFPFSVAIVVVIAFLYARIVGEIPESSITLLAGSLALYSVAVHGRPRARTPVLALCLAAIVAEVVRELFFVPPGSDLQPLAQIFLLAYNAVVLALPWALGAAIRTLRDREQELADRAAELQREREENARQAVFAERVRIARELHDVVAHHVSVMGVQAGAARRVMEQQPDKAAAALTSIEASSRDAVVELHRLLGFLRASDEADELAPQPGLAQLCDLVAQGNLAVDLLVEGDPRALPPTLDVSAYRIIQEALTNARKHSGGATATVRVSYGTATLEVEVLDDGTTRAGRSVPEGGHGLIGMRERATLHGGHLRAGPRPEGGFAVHATFPLDG
jgi:signal transduction histidine kinase